MSYQVLARKWRPRGFDQVVGQDHVVKALTNALEHDRLHHAYLFSGTRGVGKTTIARVLAKALNCLSRTSYEPCGECSCCAAVDESRFVDLIEVDAASKTRVEDTRELLENVQYSPSEGRYKIYLIDEVHMLSGHSFNALLKTLEEPPDHVKFLLATTDPQKIPVTVLSRCLQFNLKRLLPDRIREQLSAISAKENIEFETSALKILAQAADGSMRDGLSLLDQAMAFGGGRVVESEVLSMLGSVGAAPVLDLLQALIDRNPAALLKLTDGLADRNCDFTDVLQQMLFTLHRVALVQMVPETAGDDDESESLVMMSKQMTPEDVQLFYQIGIIGKRDLPLAPDPKSGFEMVLLRILAFKPETIDTEIITTSEPQKKADDITVYSTDSLDKPVLGQRALNADWLEIVRSLNVKGMPRELVMHCALQKVDEKTCTLLLDPRYRQLRSERIEKSLEKAIQDYYSKPLRLVIKLEKSQEEIPAVQLAREREILQRQAEREIEQDDNVNALKKAFDARVIPGSIEPLRVTD